MKYKHWLVVLALSPAFLGVMGCDKKDSVPTDEVVAKVNGEPLTAAELEQYANARRAQQPPSADAEKERQAVLDEMIDRMVLAQAAVEKKLDEDPEVAGQLERQRENVLARALLKKYLDEHPVTDADVEQRYKEEVAKTHNTEYRARHILLKSEEDARRVLKELKRGANFAALARRESADARSAKQGGDLGWFNEGQMIPEFFTAVKQLKKGQVSPEPVKTEFGWHVIKLEDTRPLRAPDIEQVRGNIRQLVQEERVRQAIKELRAKAKIEIEK